MIERKKRKIQLDRSGHIGIVSFILLCITLYSSAAQSLSLFDVDTTDFPVMKAKFYCFNSTGQFFYPELNQIQLFENGRPVTITGITCPPVKPPMLLSSILTVDISVSMSAGEPGKTNLDLVKAAALAWIQGLPPGQSECALTSFNDKNFINQDFTADRSLMRSALHFLLPAGATDYTKAMLDPVAGALQLSKAGRFKRVIVFLSDGMPNSPPPAAEVIAEAKKQNCTIFAVALGFVCPPVLKHIAEQTGGRWYENVTTVPQAEQAYRNIMQVALGNEPCVVEWQGDISCSSSRTAEITMSSMHLSSSEPFSPAASAVSALEIYPQTLNFGTVQPGKSKELTITLTARNQEFTVQSIAKRNGKDNFRLGNSASFPLVIPAGTSKKITLVYTPADSSRTYSGFEINAEPCNSYFSVSGGFSGKKVQRDDISLRMDFPNGGEYLIAGGDTTIRWSGISPSDTVALSYSADNGKTWKVITRRATGLSYRWRIPRTAGINFLMKVEQPSGDAPEPIRTFTSHSWWVNHAAFSPNGRTMVTSSVDNTAKIWDIETGSLIRTLSGHANWVRKAEFSPDGRHILTVSDDNTAKIWDAATGEQLQTITNAKWGIGNAAYSPDGRQVITTSADDIAKIFDASNSEVTGVLRGHTHEINDASFSPDGTRIVTGGWDNQVIVWDEKSRKPLATCSSHTKPVNVVSFSSDGNYIISAGNDNTVKLWDARQYNLLRSFGFHTQTINSAKFSPDGSLVVTTGNGDSSAKVWDVLSGTLHMTLSGHTAPVTSADFSPDGKYLMTTSRDKTAKLWDAEEQLLQDDISDARWFIISPKLAAQPVDFGAIVVGSGRDSIIRGFVQNTSDYSLRVDSIWFEHDQKGVFSLVSGLPPFTIPRHDRQSIELHCSPFTTGNYTATMVILSQTGQILRLPVSCKGVVSPIRLTGSVISFARTEVGTQRDSIQVGTIRNTGTTPITITSTYINAPEETAFSALSDTASQILKPGATARINLRFAPQMAGRMSGQIIVEYDGYGSPAEITLYGEGFNREPVVTVRAINRSTKDAIENAEVTLRGIQRNVTKKGRTDDEGLSIFTIPSGTEIEVSVSTGQLLPDSRKLTVVADTTIELSLAETMALRINFIDESETPYPFVLDSTGTETNQTWQEAIELLAKYLNQYQYKIQRFIVAGHTDDRGSAEFNQQLGFRRAKFVTDELVKRGIPEALLHPATKGESELLPQQSGEDTESYRKRCRRIETSMIFK